MRHISHRQVVSTVRYAAALHGVTLKPVNGVTIDGVKAYKFVNNQSLHTVSNEPFTLVTAYNLAIRNELTQLMTLSRRVSHPLQTSSCNA